MANAIANFFISSPPFTEFYLMNDQAIAQGVCHHHRKLKTKNHLQIQSLFYGLHFVVSMAIAAVCSPEPSLKANILRFASFFCVANHHTAQ